MMAHSRRVAGTTLILAACAAMAAGCTAAHTVPQPVPTALGTAHERAVTDAAAILRAFVVPPGALRLQQAPDALKAPAVAFYANTVDDVSFWREPGQPQAVLAWEQARLPHRFTLDSSAFPTPSSAVMFGLAPVPGLLDFRELDVQVAGAGDGQTAIRVDAQVTWQPPRPASEWVPAAARVVTITQLRDWGPNPPAPPAPVTITAISVVRRLAALVDSLQLSEPPPGLMCPASAGGIQLTFLARSGGLPLAVAQAGTGGCGIVQFSLGGQPQPALQLTDTFIPRVLKIAGGPHWNVPSSYEVSA
jgi:hypothetical protein